MQKASNPKEWVGEIFYEIIEILAKDKLCNLTQIDFLKFAVISYNYLLTIPGYKYEYLPMVNGFIGGVEIGTITICYDPHNDNGSYIIRIYSFENKKLSHLTWMAENYGDETLFTIEDLKDKNYMHHLQIRADSADRSIVEAKCPFIAEGLEISYYAND